MFVPTGAARAGWGIAFLVGAGAVAEFVAKACSSPQTVEINAGTRAPTLMKWVHIGLGEAVIMVALAALFDPVFRVPILLGGAAEAIVTYAEYLHGKESGLANGGPGTESGTVAPPSRRGWGQAGW